MMDSGKRLICMELEIEQGIECEEQWKISDPPLLMNGWLVFFYVPLTAR